MKRIHAAFAVQFTIALFFSSLVAPCFAQVWGIQPATNRIVRVDPATGNVLGGFAPPGGALVSDQFFGGLTIAEQGATLLYQNPVANPTDLFRINPNTGALLSTEFMPAADTPEFRAGLSFESGVGVGGTDAIFAVNDGDPIQRQDGYGNPLLVNHFSPQVDFGGALGGDDNGRQFVAIINVSVDPPAPLIAEFDPATPIIIVNTMPSPATFGAVGGLAFDGTWLYLSDLNGSLFTLNPDTGAVQHAVAVQGGPLIGLAARFVPEPTALLLAGLGMMLLGAGRVRRGE